MTVILLIICLLGVAYMVICKSYFTHPIYTQGQFNVNKVKCILDISPYNNAVLYDLEYELFLLCLSVSLTIYIFYAIKKIQ